MSYKIIVLAPSCGGKSSLMRYLRDHTDLQIAETDEEVMKANNNVWPDDELKKNVLVLQTTKEIISRPEVIYFASYIPTNLLQDAKSKGFSITLLDLPIEELRRRNRRRMSEEGYDDVSEWFEGQLLNFEELKGEGLVDVILDGDRKIATISSDLLQIVGP